MLGEGEREALAPLVDECTAGSKVGRWCCPHGCRRRKKKLVWMDESAKVCSRCGKQKEDPGGPQLEGRQGDVGRQAAPTPTLLADSRQVLQRIDEIDCVVDSGQVDDWLLRRAALAEKELLRKMEQAQPFDLDTRGDRMHRSIAEPRMPLLRNRHASWRPVCMEAHVRLRRADAWSQGER